MEAPKRRTVVETKTTFEGTNVTLDAYHCVKSVQIRSFFWFVFSPILTEYGVSRRIQSECGKIRTRKNSVFEHFLRSV